VSAAAYALRFEAVKAGPDTRSLAPRA